GVGRGERPRLVGAGGPRGREHGGVARAVGRALGGDGDAVQGRVVGGVVVARLQHGGGSDRGGPGDRGAGVRGDGRGGGGGVRPGAVGVGAGGGRGLPPREVPRRVAAPADGVGHDHGAGRRGGRGGAGRGGVVVGRGREPRGPRPPHARRGTGARDGDGPRRILHLHRPRRWGPHRDGRGGRREPHPVFQSRGL